MLQAALALGAKEMREHRLCSRSLAQRVFKVELKVLALGDSWFTGIKAHLVDQGLIYEGTLDLRIS
jgi:hypothetical protein